MIGAKRGEVVGEVAGSIRSGKWARRGVGAVAAGAVTVLALTACGPSDEELAAARLKAPVEFVWSYKDHLLSDVVQVDGNALAYEAEAGHMYLLARDAATGQEQWKHKALAGSGSLDDSPEVAVSEHEGVSYVSYYAVSDEGPGALRVVNAETGEPDVGSLPHTAYASRPEPCGSTFCSEGFAWSSTGTGSYDYSEHTYFVFDWEAKRWKSHSATEGEIPRVSENAEMKGSNLSASGEDDDEELMGYGRDGELLWTREFADIFGDGFSPDGTAYTTSDSEAYPLIYSQWREGEKSQDGEDTVTTYELAERSTTLRLDQDTGETVWKSPGLSLFCSGVSGGVSRDGRITLGCGYDSGTYTVRETPDGEEEDVEDLQVYAVGIDTENGEELWRHDVGKAPDATGDVHLIRDDRHVRLWDRDGEQMMVDVATGEIVPENQAVGNVSLCWESREPTEVRRFNKAGHDWGQNGDVGEIARFSMRVPCDRDELEEAESMPTLAEFRRVGYEAEQDYVVLPGPSGMAAYRLPQLEDINAE